MSGAEEISLSKAEIISFKKKRTLYWFVLIILISAFVLSLTYHEKLGIEAVEITGVFLLLGGCLAVSKLIDAAKSLRTASKICFAGKVTSKRLEGGFSTYYMHLCLDGSSREFELKSFDSPRIGDEVQITLDAFGEVKKMKTTKKFISVAEEKDRITDKFKSNRRQIKGKWELPSGEFYYFFVNDKYLEVDKAQFDQAKVGEIYSSPVA